MLAIRPANSADQESVLALLRIYCDEANTPLSDQHLLAGLVPLLAENQHGVVLVAEEEKIIGYSILTWGWGIESGGMEALVDEMLIHPSRRSEGIGEMLLQATLERAKQAGVKVVFLETEKDNPRSRKLYSKVGFEEESSIWMSYRF
ncbi:MAG: GNAT family N-acetyltransferase [Aquiluna sp.]